MGSQVSVTESKIDFVGVCNIIGRDSTNLYWVKKKVSNQLVRKVLKEKSCLPFLFIPKKWNMSVSLPNQSK